MLKYLRIAVTALSLTACVLLIALWVRSYFRIDELGKSSSTGVSTFMSGRGQLSFMSWDTPSGLGWGWTHETRKPNNDVEWSPIFSFRSHNGSLFIHAPHYPFVLATGIFAIVPWIHRLRWRFSLRTLLIATTLVAVALAAIVYSSR